jgi:transposase-like protein
MPPLVNLSSLIDDAKCYALVRQQRWPDGVRCPRCASTAVARHGRDDAQPHRQRYRCAACNARFDDLTGTVLAGHHQPLRVWVLCLYLMGLNLSNRQIANELDLGVSDVQAMTEHLRPRWRGGDRRGLRRGRPQGQPRRCRQKGRPGRRRRLKGAPGRGTLAKEKPPILGLLQRGGEVVVRMLANVQQATIQPLIEATVAKGALVHTDGYDVHARLEGWGYGHKTVCHARGEYARDDDGDGFCEVHVNTTEGFWSLLRSWLRPHRGISQEKLPTYLGFFQLVHNARRRGKALLGTLVAALIA